MLQKKIAVIGGGIGGLCSACRLAADGHSVHLYEQDQKLGGKLNEYREENYRFDTGPSLLTLPEILEETFQYCGKTLNEYLSINPIDELCRYFWPDGSQLSSYADPNKALQEIKRLSPEDAEAYLKFLDYAKKLYQYTSPTFLNSPLYQWQDFKSVNFLDFLQIDAFTTMKKRINRSFTSPYLQQLFQRFATYNGSDPAQAPATLNVIAHVELNLGGYFVAGGLYKLAEALQQLALDLGVIIQTNAKVEQLVHKTHYPRQISALQVNGQTLPFDMIVSNCDATVTHTELASDEQINRPKKQQIAGVEPSCSGFVLLLGVNKMYPQLGHHNIFFSNDYQKEFKSIFKDKKPADDPTIYIANTSYSNPEDAPEGCSNFFILVNTPYLADKQQDWSAIAYEYGNSIIAKLEEYGLEDLSSHIQLRHHITPQDFYDRFSSNKGSIYGTSSNGMFSAFARPKNKSIHFDNLFLVGGSTHPGGGIPLAALSAKHAHTIIQRELEIEEVHVKKMNRLKKAKS